MTERLQISGDTVGERIQSVMSNRGLTQEAVAAVVGTTQPDVSRILRAPDPLFLAVRRRYSEALGVPLRDLIPD